jgi:hypothetical protein
MYAVITVLRFAWFSTEAMFTVQSNIYQIALSDSFRTDVYSELNTSYTLIYFQMALLSLAPIRKGPSSSCTLHSHNGHLSQYFTNKDDSPSFYTSSCLQNSMAYHYSILFSNNQYNWFTDSR